MDKMPIVEDFEEQINEETKESNPNFQYDNETTDNPSLNGMGEDLEIKEVIEETQPSPPSKMTKAEIFDIPSPKEEKPKKEKKPRKKRPPMSEEHKEKLKKAREKALETRRRNAQEKREMKELEKRAKQKKKDNLKKFVEGDTEHASVKEAKPQVVEKVIKQDIDIEKAVLEGIMKYETIRKDRKKKKQEQQAIEKDKEKLKKQINNAVQPQGAIYHGQQGYFDNCF